MPSASTPAAPVAVRIGCAGWSIPSRDAPLFGNEGHHLARYATRFDCVEINSTFHRSHRRATFERWAASVPPGFLFSVKLPRTITHDARLERVCGLLTTFFDDASGLGTAFGGVLVQLPPSLGFDAAVAARFLGMLRRRWQGPVALEPRHAGWFTPAAQALLQRHRVARVAADPAAVAGAGVPGGAGVDARWRYWRWHGSPRRYYSRYEEAALRALASSLVAAAHARAPAWCILDNTAHGHAIGDAARLQAFVGELLAESVRASTRCGRSRR